MRVSALAGGKPLLSHGILICAAMNWAAYGHLTSATRYPSCKVQGTMVSERVRDKVCKDIEALLPDRARYRIRYRTLSLDLDGDSFDCISELEKVLALEKRERSSVLHFWQICKGVATKSAKRPVIKDETRSISWQAGIILRRFGEPSSKDGRRKALRSDLFTKNFKVSLVELKGNRYRVSLMNRQSFSLVESPRNLLSPNPVVRIAKGNLMSARWQLKRGLGLIRYSIDGSPVLGSYSLVLDGASRTPIAATFHRQTVSVAAAYSWTKVGKRRLWVDSISRARVCGKKLFAEWIVIDKVRFDPEAPLRLVVPESSEVVDQRLFKPRNHKLSFASFPEEVKTLMHLQSDK